MRETLSSSSSRRKEFFRFLPTHYFAHEPRFLGEDLPHLLLDVFEIFGREGMLHQKIVLELLAVIRPADVDLRVREETLHGIRHHVLGGMADHLARLRIFAGDDLDRCVGVERSAQIHQAPIEAAREGRSREPRSNGPRNVQDRRTHGNRQRVAIRQSDLEFTHRGWSNISVCNPERLGAGPPTPLVDASGPLMRWLARAVSNRRPPPCQGGALPLSYVPSRSLRTRIQYRFGLRVSIGRSSSDLSSSGWGSSSSTRRRISSSSTLSGTRSIRSETDR